MEAASTVNVDHAETSACPSSVASDPDGDKKSGPATPHITCATPSSATTACVLLPHRSLGWAKSVSRLRALASALEEGLDAAVQALSTAMVDLQTVTDPSKLVVLLKIIRTENDLPGDGRFLVGGADCVLASVALLACECPRLFPNAPPSLLRQRSRDQVSLTPRQIACLLANAFFGLCPWQPHGAKLRDHNGRLAFHRWYDDAMLAPKIRCLLHYFSATTSAGPRQPRAPVLFTRKQTPVGVGCDNRAPLQTLHLCTDGAETGRIESCCRHRPASSDVGTGHSNASRCLQVDFANKMIGGGVLGGGAAQEEIRFCVCPELIVTIMLVEEMLDDEAVEVGPVQQFARYSGYGRSFQCAGPFVDPTPGALVVAMDAYFFPMDRQYSEELLRREFRKALAGFSQCPPQQAIACSPAAACSPTHASASISTGRSPSSNSNDDSSASPKLGKPVHAQSSTAGSTVPVAHIATGNWGCGVFGGDVQLKALLQWAAASSLGLTVQYFSMGHPMLEELPDLVARTLRLLHGGGGTGARDAGTVGWLFQILCDYDKVLRKHLQQQSDQMAVATDGLEVEPPSVFEFVRARIEKEEQEQQTRRTCSLQ